MWTRYHIECKNCEKTTNLRVQIPEKKELPIEYNCPECKSEIKAKLTVDLVNANWDFQVERGELVKGDFHSGDFFIEFSDTLPTKNPSKEPHNIVLPTLRMPSQKLMELKDIKDRRKMFSEEDIQDFRDLTHAYSDFNKDVIRKLSQKILGEYLSEKLFEFKIDLDYQRIYFIALNHFVFPWINEENHIEFVNWLLNDVYTNDNRDNSELINYSTVIITDDYYNHLKREILTLVNRFIELREYFHYAYNDNSSTDTYASVEGFNKLKNFYTDCFEFLGRNSHLVFRIQNLIERGSQDAVPIGSPRNVTTANEFSSIDNGRKLDIISLSSQETPKKVFNSSFDSKLRNGINHFKAKLDVDNQIISYYPITRRPEEEFQISYLDFLNKTLDIFNSVLKVGQILKFRNNFKALLDGKI